MKHISFADLKKSVSSFSRQSLVVIVINLFSAFSLFFFQLFLANSMTEYDFGLFSFVLSSVTIVASLSLFGIDSTTIKLLAEYKAKKQHGNISNHIKYVIKHYSYSIIFIILVIGIFLYLNGIKENVILFSIIAGILIPGVLILQSILRGMNFIEMSVVPEGLIRPLLLLSIVSVFYLLEIKLDAFEAIYIYDFTLILVIIFIFIYIKKKIILFSEKKEENNNPIFTLNIAMFVIGASAMMNSQIGTVMMGMLSTKEQTGVFNVAYKLSTFVAFGIPAINVVLAPKISHYNAISDRKALLYTFMAGVLAVFAISLPIAGVFYFFPHELLNMYGPSFVSGAEVLKTLTLLHLLGAVFGVLGLLAMMSNRHGFYACIQFCAVSINAFLCLQFIPDHGIYGATYAYSASVVFIMLGLTSYYAYRFFKRRVA